MEGWAAELVSGRPDAAWDAFVDRYRRLIFAAIRHYAQDYDDVMDVFARVCEALREDDLRRLRTYVAQPDHRARFSTWLVTVVRHLTVDWFRHRDVRRRLSPSRSFSASCVRLIARLRTDDAAGCALSWGARRLLKRRRQRVPATSLTRGPTGASARRARRRAGEAGTLVQ